jgi:hypothetical protein
LNLDVILQGFEMKVRSFSSVDSRWSAMDLDAIDRVGDLHFFEMKREGNRGAEHALAQLVGYAMRSQTHESGMCRVLPPEKMRNAVRLKVAEWTGENPAEDTLETIDGSQDEGSPIGANAENRFGLVHLHVVVPDVLKFRPITDLASRLLNNGSVPVWLWDVRLVLDDGGKGGGSFYLHRADFDFRVRRVPDPYRPFRVRAALGKECIELANGRAWNYGIPDGEIAGLWTPIADGIGLHIRTTSTKVSLHLFRDRNHPDRETLERRFFGHCLLGLGDTPSRAIAKHLEAGTGKQPLKWNSVLYGEVIHFRRGGGLITQAEVEFENGSVSEDVIAKVLRDWLVLADELARKTLSV